ATSPAVADKGLFKSPSCLQEGVGGGAFLRRSRSSDVFSLHRVATLRSVEAYTLAIPGECAAFSRALLEPNSFGSSPAPPEPRPPPSALRANPPPPVREKGLRQPLSQGRVRDGGVVF